MREQGFHPVGGSPLGWIQGPLANNQLSSICQNRPKVYEASDRWAQPRVSHSCLGGVHRVCAFPASPQIWPIDITGFWTTL